MDTLPSKISHAWLCQIHSGKIVPIFGNLLLSHGKIQQVQPLDYREFMSSGPLPTEKPYSTAQEIDAAGRVVTVPLINFHEHFYSRLAKGLPLHGPLDSFIHILENLWWKLDSYLDADMIRASAQMAIRECLNQGVTYVYDHHASSSAQKNSLTLIAELLKENHLRGVVCCETSDRHGPEKMREALEENRRFIREMTSGDVRGMLGLHAPFTMGDESLAAAANLRQELDAAIHIHLAEDDYEQAYSWKNFSLSPVERLHRFGLLTDRSLLGHGIHLTAADHEVIARLGSALVYNPDSNMNNQVGLPEYATVPPTIPLLPGTDGMHANITRTLKQLFLLYRHQGNSFEDSFSWFQKIYFDSLSFVRHFFNDFPSLQSGDRADLVIWDYAPPTPVNGENIWGHLIYGVLESPVFAVLQEGQVLLHRYQKDELRERKLFQDIFVQGDRLYERFRQEAG